MELHKRHEKTILCFDLDGTLADSTQAYVEAFKLAFDRNNLPPRGSDEIKKWFGLPALQIIKNLYPRISDRKLPTVAKHKTEFFLEKTFKLVKPITGVSEAIEELKKNYFLAVVSNSSKDEIVSVLRQAGIPPRTFDAAVAASDVAYGKPDGDEIFKVQEKLKAKCEYVIGDTTYDVVAGKAAGRKTVAVLSGIHNLEQLGAENPTIIIKSVALLPDLLFGRL